MTEAEVAALPMGELIDHYLGQMRRISHILIQFRTQLRWKPLVGGCFGNQGFVLISHWTIKGGLDEVAYYVADKDSMLFLSRGESKQVAIGNARLMLTKHLTPYRLQSECATFKAEALAAEEERRRTQEQASEERRAAIRAAADPIKSIPRRRKQIFDESGGKCHYCATSLTLDGRWHIEHKMPKALGGGNEPGNLVASCVPCNMKKRDRTDVEFKAAMEKAA